jgi:hypothetical protein
MPILKSYRCTCQQVSLFFNIIGLSSSEVRDVKVVPLTSTNFFIKLVGDRTVESFLDVLTDVALGECVSGVFVAFCFCGDD